MPLILDRHHVEDVRAGTGFDLQTAVTNYWKPVPVKLKQVDKEDRLEHLTFRILTGVARQNPSLKILRIHISSESDLSFLHTLEVSDDDFQSLKTEQGILVDFASFPGKIISLLEKCTAPQPTDAPRFTSVLTVRGAEALFKILETNDFKQLPHITLAFRPGNDATVKQFLAFRLQEVRADCDGLSTELQAAQEECKEYSQQLSASRLQLAALREQYERHMMEAAAAAKTAQAEAHEEKARDRAELREQLERQHEEEASKLRERVELLTSRLAEAEADNRKLRDVKYDLDSKVSELSHRLGSVEGANRSLEEECGRLRAQVTSLSAAKHDADLALHELKTRAGALDEKVLSQSEVVEQQRARLADLEGSVRQWEARCNELRGSTAAAEQRTAEAQAELNKANASIDKLVADLRSSKEKVRRKQAILQRQEEELQGRDAALATAQREASALTQQLESARGESSGLKVENGELKSRLEESRQQLQSNEQMIRWLNQQVTEKERLVSGALTGSRYSFQPMLTATAVGGSSAGGLGPASTSGLGGGTTLTAGHATPALRRLPGPPESTYVSKYSSSYSLGARGLYNGVNSSGGTDEGHDQQQSGSSVYGAGGTRGQYSVPPSPTTLRQQPTPGGPYAGGGVGGRVGFSGVGAAGATGLTGGGGPADESLSKYGGFNVKTAGDGQYTSATGYSRPSAFGFPPPAQAAPVSGQQQ